MCHATRVRSTCLATTLALTIAFHIRSNLFVVREIQLAPKMTNNLGTGNSDGGEFTRRPSHTVLQVWSQRCVALLAHDLLHALHIYFIAFSPLIFMITC